MAVRCFTSEISDQNDRYAKLHTYIIGKQAKMFVEFEYQPQGICVNRYWYTIIKMEWIDGVTLDQEFEKCVNN